MLINKVMVPRRLVAALFPIILVASFLLSPPYAYAEGAFSANEIQELRDHLSQNGFTGDIQSTLEDRLGRRLNQDKVELGKSIFFDQGLSLHKTNSCAACHSPTAGFGDTQSIAIGIQSNNIVGKDRKGPRNQRRTPTIANTAFYPALMWNGRFSSVSGDPFDNSKGYLFPEPEGEVAFPKGDKRYSHLLIAQAHIPFTELPEMAGFKGIKDTGLPLCQAILPLASPSPAQANNNRSTVRQQLYSASNPPDFCQFDDVNDLNPTPLPKKYPDSDYLNAPIRHTVVSEINQIEPYRRLFSNIYPAVKSGNEIDFSMIGDALSEFQISQTYANAPIDRFAKGDMSALTPSEIRGGSLFFGKAKCVSCHAVKGKANEMFSDFKMYNAGIPQIAAVFGKSTGNVPFRDSNGDQSSEGNQDFGLREFSGLSEDSYKFRASPLRNVSLQPTFFHNGSFTRLDDALRYHMNTVELSKSYVPASAGVAEDLTKNIGPIDPVIASLDPQLVRPLGLTDEEFTDLNAFVSNGLLDQRAKPDELMKLIPSSVPSGAKLHVFQKP